ncbi:hypothetical protein GJ496_006709 [Pomphorhynchus laevis]|nr:hypothetical protein GJ496_006709 [Pomphorhynchus laevis]
MESKFDPTAVYTVFIKCRGGDILPEYLLAPKFFGFDFRWNEIKFIAKEISDITKDYKDLKVTIQFTVQNRKLEMMVVPTASSLIIKALNEPQRDRKKVKNVRHNGTITFDDVIDIARLLQPRSMSRQLVGTVKSVLGTCNSVGCLIDGKSPRQVINAINEGTLAVPSDKITATV